MCLVIKIKPIKLTVAKKASQSGNKPRLDVYGCIQAGKSCGCLTKAELRNEDAFSVGDFNTLRSLRKREKNSEGKKCLPALTPMCLPHAFTNNTIP